MSCEPRSRRPIARPYRQHDSVPWLGRTERGATFIGYLVLLAELSWQPNAPPQFRQCHGACRLDSSCRSAVPPLIAPPPSGLLPPFQGSGRSGNRFPGADAPGFMLPPLRGSGGPDCQSSTQSPHRRPGSHHCRSSLKACVHSLRRKPGMHQRMQRGSMARAASALPMSTVSQPN
jgi:hypothetical protein